MFVNSARSAASVFIAAMFLVGAMNSALGQAQGEYAVFNGHDPQSTETHFYKDWDQFLNAVVFDVGPSHRFRESATHQLTAGSRLGGGSSGSPSWLEGNRVRLHLFKNETLQFLENMKADMVEAAEGGDIASWNRDEQLAYWLNLHNLLVMQVAGENYPYRSAKKLRRKNWTREMVTVKGVSLSIQEIQDEIVLSIWRDPMVVYGLFQGAIGGPSLRPLALQGNKIGISLQKNGEEFVNSYRGVHAGGKSTTVSEFYKWTARAFPDFETDLRRHLLSLADDKTSEIMKKKSGIRSAYYNWKVPDFYAGRMHFANSSSISAATAVKAGDRNEAYPLRFADISLMNDNHKRSHGKLSSKGIPDHTLQFISGLQRKFRAYDMPNKGITFDEMLTGRSPSSGR